MSEIDITIDQAREFVQNNDAYGMNRLYGIIGANEECAGQIAGIKSEYHLDRFAYDRIYIVSRDPKNPLGIRQA